MAKAKAAAISQQEPENAAISQQSDTVEVPKTVLKQFCTLYESLESADTIYQQCQSALFRNFAAQAYKARNMREAYDAAKAFVGEQA